MPTKKELELRKRIALIETQLQAVLSEEEEINHELEKLLTSESVESASKSLYSFYQQSWDVFETVPFLSNWHLECICNHLEAVYRGEIQNILLEVPPRHSKSSIINIAFPVWVWLQDPTWKFITAAHGDSLALRDAVKSRQLIDSPWFKRNWGEKVKLKVGSNQKSKYENTENGYRLATSVTGRAVGEGFDCQTPYTKILTNKGPIEIERLYNEQDNSIRIATYNLDTGLTQYLQPHRFLRSQLRDRMIVRITFPDNSYTDCTHDHKWYTKKGYIEAQDLSSSSYVLSLEGWRKISKVEKIQDNSFSSSYWVYTLSMPPNGNYFVVPEGSDSPVLAKNCLIVDDPIKPLEANSKVALNAVIEWWTGTMPSRANSPDSRRVVMHQRLHDCDLIGYIKDHEADKWEIITLPMLYEPTTFVSSIGWQDPRREENEVLWKERFPPHEVSRLQNTLGTFGFAAQYQQRPAAKEGGIIKRDWFKYYAVPFNEHMLHDFELIIQSWDLSFGDTGDFTVGQVWGKKGPNKYLLDQVRGKWTFTEQITKIRQLRSLWRQTRVILVENKANGAAVIDTLRKEIPGLIAINPREIGGGGKEVRLSACALDFEAGNIYVPSTNISSYVADLIDELCTFPKSKYDDSCDSLSQALNWLASKAGNNIAIIPTDKGLDSLNRIAPRKGEGTSLFNERNSNERVADFSNPSRNLIQQASVSDMRKLFG